MGTGRDLSIAELADLIADTVGYRGEIRWDTGKPDGTYRKLLDIRRITELGWHAKISLTEGIRTTYEWFGPTRTTTAAESCRPDRAPPRKIGLVDLGPAAVFQSAAIGFHHDLHEFLHPNL